MAKGYFENFPTMLYDSDGSGQYKQVVDIFRRVSLRNNLSSYLESYVNQIIDGTQKPERLAHSVYNDPHKNWMIMMLNEVENPFEDWFLSEKEFYLYMSTKYPNKSLTFSNHNSTNIFLKDENLQASDSSGAVVGTVVSYNATMSSIVYKTDSSISTGDILYGQVSEKTGTVGSTAEEMYGPHHLDSSGAVVSNWDYEYGLNEAKSQVNIIQDVYVDRLEDEFIKKIK